MAEILDIVNENDEVIGQIDRADPELENHIVRTVVIGFYTPDKKILLQQRSLAKKTNPGKMTATVTGHVESGSTYEETVLKEGFEETGVHIDMSKVHYIGKEVISSKMRSMYAYPFDGTADNLTIEEGEGDGFVAMTIPELRQACIDTPDKFTPILHSQTGRKLLDYIESV